MIKLPLTNCIEAGICGGFNRDILIVAFIQNNQKFERDCHNLDSHLSSLFALAALGGNICIKTVDVNATWQMLSRKQSELISCSYGFDISSSRTRTRNDQFKSIRNKTPKKDRPSSKINCLIRYGSQEPKITFSNIYDSILNVFPQLDTGC
jgi:DnaJ-class molecular chaperone